MNHRKPQLTAFRGAMCYVLMAGAPALADDTEIFTGSTGSNTLPNVVFIIDTSGSMNTNLNGITRLQTAQNALTSLVNNTNGINVAVMRFDSGGMGGYFIQPMQELNATNRTGIIASVNGLTAGGNTPLAETLYEATQYYRGGTVEFGGNNVGGVLDPQNTNRYLSPITQECNQSNHIVLLTDGAPTDDSDADSLIRAPNLPGYNSGACSFVQNDPTGTDCLDELAHYLHNNDLSTTIDGEQTVTTHTIGFTTDTAANDLLSATATNGGGQFKPAANAGELSTALTEILDSVNADARGSFVSPALGVDAFNRTSHRNALYFALFQGTANRIWDGNVKSYKLDGDPIRIVDAAGADVLTSSGQFVTTSRSLWSTTADGAQVIDGGANGKIPAPALRNLYTKAANTAGALTALSAADPTLFGLTAGQTTERDAFVATALSSKIADPLHSKLAVVNYGGTEANPDITLFVGTNAGFLHAIDAETGAEQFAYAPKELLQTNVTQLGASGSHLYGLDGSPVIWMNDANHNGVVYASNGALETGEHVYAYIGMRRGGRNYYALDVTNRSAPELKWVIEGGSADFAELGQTWSKPVLAKMRHGGHDTKVLVFAGGYDTNQDTYIPSTADTVGRAIYIVDASTGVRLWWAGPTGSGADLEVASFTHSIPSDVRVIDSDMDGYADRLYVGDMGGQVFRADLPYSATGAISGSVTLLADLGDASPNNRRFYNAPDVALARTAPGAPLYYAINIGSGYRAHPKDKGDAAATPPRAATNDRFYSIKDFHVHDSNFSSDTLITESTMLDVTSNDIGEATGDTQQDAIDALNDTANRGWYIRLTTPGEKVLAESLTINGTLYFTTYVPPSTGGTGCVPPIGNGRFYVVSLFNATPVIDNTEDSTLTAADRFITLGVGGIPPAPALVFVPRPAPPCTGADCTPQPPGDPTLKVCVGAECPPAELDTEMYRTYWKQ